MSAERLKSCVYIADNETTWFLQEAGKQLHMDPTLSKALFLLPSLLNLGQGGIGLHVEHPLRGAGSGWALDCAVSLLKASQTSFSPEAAHWPLNTSNLA